MYDDIRKNSRLILPPLSSDPDSAAAHIKALEEQNDELRMSERTRDIIDVVLHYKHLKDLELARKEGFEAARLGVEIEHDTSPLDCGEIPMPYVKFHFSEYAEWKRARDNKGQ